MLTKYRIISRKKLNEIKEILEKTEDLLDELQGGISYDDPNGPWGLKCSLCSAQTVDGFSSLEHDDDCSIRTLRELINNLDLEGEVQD